jgi:Zn finger protein HypA/HybF involved in hydrogenase expression
MTGDIMDCEWCGVEIDLEEEEGNVCPNCRVIKLLPVCATLLDPTGEPVNEDHYPRHAPCHECGHMDTTVTVEYRPDGEEDLITPDWVCPSCGGSDCSWTDARRIETSS